MKLSDQQIDFLSKNTIVALATTSNNKQPRVIFVDLNVINSEELIFTDNQMMVSAKNIKTNNKVFLTAFNQKWQGLKISGIAKLYRKGKYFEMVKRLPGNAEYQPKGAVVIKPINIENFQ